MTKLIATAAGLILGLSTGVGIATAPAATADEGTSYTLSFTGGVGAYPRSTPEYSSRTGTALPEGATIDPSCWMVGGNVTNPAGYTSSVWIRDEGARYWPESWLSTGSDGVPEGLTSCDDIGSADAQPTRQANCSPGGDYVDGSIVVTDTVKGQQISITPTQTARDAWGNGDGRNSTVSIWHAVQDCVPDLYGKKADSVWQQLECHQRFATIRKPSGSYATGDTYDLETWIDPLGAPSDLTYVLSHCLNEPIEDNRYLAPLRLFAITG